VTAPLCVCCGVKSVHRSHGTRPGKRGWRMVEGVRWRWYCSRACAGAVHGRLTNRSPQFRAGQQAYRQQALQRRLARYIAICKDVMTPEGLVPLKSMVRVLAEVERTWHSRGWDAAMESMKRKQAA
jgi:hypothetical protein